MTDDLYATTTVLFEGRYLTYGRKQGKVSPLQLQQLQQRLPELELPDAWMASPKTGRLIIEIGFGNGEFISMLAQRYPQDRFIGIEVFFEGIQALVRRIDRHGLGNVAILSGHAYPLLAERIADQCIDWTIINFPDPWPRKRNHKRRLIQMDFLDLLARKSCPNAHLTLATDWDEYADWMMQRLEAHPAWQNAVGHGQWAPQPTEWLTTRFQSKGEAAGRSIHHLDFYRLEESDQRLSHPSPCPLPQGERVKEVASCSPSPPVGEGA
ncbi:MAG: tRNA (guanosine(46)-N7)-methyltransferase TrmB, partial [Magnetococcales bacterium]|nr:tRNA (guanosine(46)-N7)-methyltransferase TrmB [Magnetococcales bacterium]